MTPLKKLERRWLVVVFEVCSVESSTVADRWSFYPVWIRDRPDSRLTPLFRSFLIGNRFSHLPICSLCSGSYYLLQLCLNLPLWKTDVYLTHLCVNPC